MSPAEAVTSPAVRRRAAIVIPSLPARAVHLWVLCAFALSQPLFDLLGRNAAFFAVRGSSPMEIVLFTVAVTVVPPLVLLLVEVAAAVVGRSASAAAHLVFVALLGAVVALQALKRIEDASDGVVVVAAAVSTGGVLALVYARTRVVPLVLGVLGPTPVLFAALFLFGSPVKELLAATSDVPSARVQASTPVVLIVFDELSTVSLMRGDERIDRVRFPSFAALAADSTWYRSASTVHGHSHAAVPAILTGLRPRTRSLPVLRDHPRNVFTLLGGRYDIRAVETLTRLCPRRLCRSTVAFAPEEERPLARARSLLSDVGIVYLHVVLPRALEARVPPVSDTWRDFGREEREDEARSAQLRVCTRNVCDFAALLTRSRRPTLNFLHTILPHVPWAYLPSGRKYRGDVRDVPGVEAAGRWRRDEWLTTQAYQRYLLQLGYTDRALGMLLDRLRRSGLYDRSLVVVTADHGLSFRPGEPRRNATPENLDEVAFVPLFVKLPRQRRARVDDGHAETVDILPTIADAIGVRLPWPVDGRSLLRGGRRGEVAVAGARSSVRELRARRRTTLARQMALFGTGSFARVYAVGPNRELLGRRVGGLRLGAVAGSVRLEGAGRLDSVDRDAAVLPVYLTGEVRAAGTSPHELAFALDDRIVAVTRAYEEGRRQRFAVMLPERALHDGSNRLAVFRVARRDDRRVLQPLR